MRTKCPYCGKPDLKIVPTECYPEIEEWLSEESITRDACLIIISECGWFETLVDYSTYGKWYAGMKKQLKRAGIYRHNQ